MSNGVAPSSWALTATCSRDTKINSACGSTNFLMSQGQATRSTFTRSRVIHFIAPSLGLVDAEFSIVTVVLRNGKEEAIEFRGIGAGAGATARRFTDDAFVTVALAALNHVEKTFATGKVETVPSRIEEQVVRVA